MSIINLPREMRIGAGSVGEIGELVAALGAERPIIVTDKFLVSTGVIDAAVSAMRDAGVDAAVFDDTVPDPTTESLARGVAAVQKHRADLVIGFGGGSPMDTAKALALLAVQGGTMRDYKVPHVNLGPALPVVAVSTTAGSGSEATRFTIVTDSATDEKMLCTGPVFVPVAAIVDYELTLSMPPRLTADTGVDALAHAIESHVSRKANAFASGMALQAMAAIGAHLRRAYADGSDRTAREAMMLAATQAGIAMSNASVTLVHGMSRPIGGHFHVAHGLSNAMLFPAVTEFSVEGATDRYATCARAFGCASDSDADDKAARLLVEELVRLNDDLDVPTPAAFGIDEAAWNARLPLMAEQAVGSGSPANNPVVPTADEIHALYLRIYR